MIDEELYQQAADELNSDRRRAHIWARACALASDDHDEARYLYTNLRVEELIAEREAGGFSAAQHHPQAEENDTTLALEPLQLDEDELSPATTADAFRLDDEELIPESVSAPSGIDRAESPDDFLQLLPDDDEPDEAAISSERAGFADRMERHNEQNAAFDASSQFDSTSQFESTSEIADSAAQRNEDDDLLADHKSLEDDFLDSYAEHQENIKAAAREETPDEFISNLDLNDTDPNGTQHSGRAHDEQQLDFDGTTELDLSPEEIARINASDEPAISPYHGGELVDEDRLYTANQKERGDNEFGWLHEDEPATLPATQKEVPLTPSEQEEERLAQELARQADYLPGQRSDVIEHADLVDDSREAAFAAHQSTRRGFGESSGFRDQVDSQPYNLPVDLTLGRRGKEYAVYKREAKSQAVSTGVSWSALFFTLPFLIYRHLFGTAIVYAVLWIITLGGLLLSGLAWMDAGPAATTLTKACTIGFALLAIIGLLYLPFRYGNTWRGEKLERRGFELVAWVRASNPGKAVSRARRAAALD